MTEGPVEFVQAVLSQSPRSQAIGCAVGGCSIGVYADMAQQVANLAFEAIYTFGIAGRHFGIVGIDGFRWPISRLGKSVKGR
jgi:hypothetical protein